MGRRNRQRTKLAAPVGEYRDAEGNLLALRGSLPPAARREYADVLAGGPLGLMAAALDLSEEAVRQRLSRGRAMLNERLTKTVETALLRLLGDGGLGRVLDVGTGTGRMLEFLAPRLACGLGIDASSTMLALARVRLAKPEFSHLGVRLADMYALPLHDAAYDLVLLQMVLHYAEEPGQVIAEASRVLAPGGRLAVVALAAHDRAELRERLAHRTLGFSDTDMAALLAGAGLHVERSTSVAGPLAVRIWCCRAAIPADQHTHSFEAAL